MKIIALNGSINSNGNTKTTLDIMAKELKLNGIDVEILHVANKGIKGCLSCRKCLGTNTCIIKDDCVNDYIEKMRKADGLILAAPVYYAGMPGHFKSFLDRAFVVNACNGNFMRHKIGASLAVSRRDGGMHVVDELNKYIQYSEMFMPSSNYWTSVYGRIPGDLEQDTEGIQIAKVLSKNMAWLMKAMNLAKKEIPLPKAEEKIWTSFVR